MLLDTQNLFSDGQAITASAASADIIDLGADADIGPGNEVHVFASIVEAFDNLTSLQIDFETSDTDDFASPELLVSTGAVALANLGVGARPLATRVPHGAKRFLRMNYTVAGTAPTVGKVTAGLLINEAEKNTHYPDNSPIL